MFITLKKQTYFLRIYTQAIKTNLEFLIIQIEAIVRLKLTFHFNADNLGLDQSHTSHCAFYSKVVVPIEIGHIITTIEILPGYLPLMSDLHGGCLPVGVRTGYILCTDVKV